MKVVFESNKESAAFDPEDIMGENPFDIGPFIDTRDNVIYLPVNDSGNGPFWVKIATEIWEAYCTENLPVYGPLVSIDPTITISY